jgi:hypothetical protein
MCLCKEVVPQCVPQSIASSRTRTLSSLAEKKYPPECVLALGLHASTLPSRIHLHIYDDARFVLGTPLHHMVACIAMSLCDGSRSHALRT